MRNRVERFEDMSRRGRLTLLQQEDGDMIISIIPDPNSIMCVAVDVEFCTYTGGGQSPHTLKALRELMAAMEKDNAENPQDRS